MKNIIPVIQHTLTLVAGIVLTLLVLPFIGGSLPFAVDDSLERVPTPVPDTVIPTTLSEQEAILGNLYEQLAPSVVSITFGIQLNGESLFTSVSTGSGFVIDDEGHIVTNAHVVQVPPDVQQLIAESEQDVSIQATQVEVSLFDGTITAAEIIGTDLDSDLAVIKVDLEPDLLFPTTFADSDSLRVGETVLAIGNPFSNDWTMTTGIISALNRSIQGLDGFSIGGVIQTDAAINPGNSGGPLLNLDGEVIGVNSQINSESGVSSGIGFAVPSNLAQRVAQTLIAEGTVEYSFIGIQSLPIDLDLMNAFELPNNLRGVAVLAIFEGMPAADAGVQGLSNTGVDIITAIDDTPVADFDELIGYLAINTVPGDTVTLTIYRGDEFVEIPVTLTERPNSTANADEDETPEDEPAVESDTDDGEEETEEDADLE